MPNKRSVRRYTKRRATKRRYSRKNIRSKGRGVGMSRMIPSLGSDDFSISKSHHTSSDERLMKQAEDSVRQSRRMRNALSQEQPYIKIPVLKRPHSH